MELTKEQIQQIENYLDYKGLKHIDVRFEVLDHMISDVETSIQEHNLSFSEAFKNTKMKWKKQLKNDSSWMIGLAFTAPSIVIKKAKESYKKWFLIIVLFTLIPIVLIPKLIFIEVSFYIFKWTSTLFIFILFMPISFWYFKMKQKKLKTTQLFLFEKQVFYASISILIFSLLYNFSSVSYSFYFIPIQIVLLYLGKNLYSKHLENVKKYQLQHSCS